MNAEIKILQRLIDATPLSSPSTMVVSELGMPYVDGRKVATEVKQASPGTPVILLTGWGQKLITEGEIPKVGSILSKPPKLSTLRETFASLAVAVP